jgi:MFS family permease
MGFLTTAYIPSASMLIIENNPRREWASRISLYNFFTGLGFSLGMMVGAFWLSFESLRTLFLALATISVVGVVMSTYMIKEPLVTIERHAISVITSEIVDHIRYFPTLMVNLPELFNISNWSKMIRSRLLRDLPYFYLSSAILFTAFSMFFTPLPTYYRSIGASNSNVFLLLLIHGFTLTFASILVRRLSRKSEKLLLRSGLLIRIVAFLAFAVASATGFFVGRDWSIAVIMVLTGISWPFYWVPSLTFLSKIADQNRLGEAQGTLNSMIGLGNVLGSLFSGYLVTIMNYQLNFVSSVIMMIIGFGLIADLLS